MLQINQIREIDRERLYQICLLTGDSGSDATGIHDNPEMLGDVYAGPYLELSPESCFALRDNSENCVGYGLSILDTRNFESQCREKWWPHIQAKYENLRNSQEQCWLIREIFNPTPAPKQVLKQYPSHAHIDLLPDFQGQGFGRKLMQTMEGHLRDLGSTGIHLRVSPSNVRAINFYKALGYSIIDEESTIVIVGKQLNAN